MTGTYFAPMGFYKGMFAIVIGHIIGCAMLFLSGIIGGKMRKSAMETVKTSFGEKGGCIFAILNIIQLIGWTGIMIADGAIAANGIYNINQSIWAIVIGILIAVWILIGVRNVGKINTVAMTGLFVLTVIMSIVIFTGTDITEVSDNSMSFGAAVKLSVAMPLAWLPVISDYTKEAEKPVKATALSSIVYCIVSTWMYIIGMGAAIFTNEYDIAQIMLKAGLGIAGLGIVILSTVTTTFLDTYSAGVSTKSLSQKLNSKQISIVVTIIGTIFAIIFPIDNITNFLYFIGSVFAPMIAVQIADFFILKNNAENNSFNICNIIIWFIGFILYRYLMTVDIIVGSTLPDMIITAALCVTINKVKHRIKVQKK